MSTKYKFSWMKGKTNIDRLENHPYARLLLMIAIWDVFCILFFLFLPTFFSLEEHVYWSMAFVLFQFPVMAFMEFPKNNDFVLSLALKKEHEVETQKLLDAKNNRLNEYKEKMQEL